MKPTAAFIFSLVQDVNILRPIAIIAARDFGFQPLFLISSKFSPRDFTGTWTDELEELAATVGATRLIFNSEWEAVGKLAGHGILFAASETHLPNHATVHDIFRACPSTFVRITIQHGFECVGYLHSADHALAHGSTASFGADYVCAWSSSNLQSMSPSQRAKLIVTGPTAILQQPPKSMMPTSNSAGIVCENLHSVRFRGPGERASEFVQAFADFCQRMGPRKVALRPHPGGQYVLKNKVPLPRNAYVENAPAYRVDFRQFRYGISAPSSVLIDMLIAGIPTAVWRDADGAMDSDNYAGLTSVTSPDEWVAFAQSAESDPAPFLKRQGEFLSQTGMVLDPDEVFGRFASLFESVSRRELRPLGSIAQRHRIMFVANSRVPTLQLSFDKPLAGPVARGEVYSDLITEQQLISGTDPSADETGMIRLIEERLSQMQPTALVFCRYSGPGSRAMVRWARSHSVPIIYHIDDDLLAIPPDIGERKHALHNAPERLAAVRSLLQSADLVYCSTERLKARLLEYFPNLKVIAGKIYCSGSVLRRPKAGDKVVVGYMASADHAHNLEMILPAIERLLDAHENVRFEFFGSIPMPASLRRFGDRISTAPPVADYARFLEEFAKREWDIGICPLVPIDFNLMKANTKWVEYSSAGVAVVASRGTVYDESCADGCGMLAEGVDEWFDALESLVTDAEERCAQVQRAQVRLVEEYSLKRLREQVFDVIAGSTDRCAQSDRSENLEKVCV